jgi:DNA/RNA-binding domain of Phe-tRNA-synthetase-like protein
MVNAINIECDRFEWCLNYFQKFGNQPDCNTCTVEAVRRRLEEDDGEGIDD